MRGLGSPALGGADLRGLVRSNSLRGGAVAVAQDLPDADFLSPDRVQCRSKENPEPLVPDSAGKKLGKDTAKLTAEAGMRY